MKLAQINAFVTLVDSDLNISQTAEKLHTAQSAVSRYIQLLEHELGVCLFERRGKRLVSLSPFGEILLQHAQMMLKEEQHILKVAQEFSNPESGILRIATTHTQAKYFLPAAIEHVYKKFPKIQLRLHQGTPKEIIHMLNKQTADIAVCTEELSNHAHLNVKECYTWHHCVIVPKNHPLANREHIALKDLRFWPLITYVFGFTGRSALQAHFEENNVTPNVVLSASDTDIIKSYVRLQFGIGIIADIAFSKEDSQHLVRIPISDVMSSTTSVAWQKNSFSPSHIKETIDIISSTESPYWEGL